MFYSQKLNIICVLDFQLGHISVSFNTPLFFDLIWFIWSAASDHLNSGRLPLFDIFTFNVVVSKCVMSKQIECFFLFKKKKNLQRSNCLVVYVAILLLYEK